MNAWKSDMNWDDVEIFEPLIGTFEICLFIIVIFVEY